MVICEDILLSLGAKLDVYNPDDFIFHEGTQAKYYFQIKLGTVKVNNFLEDGKEFIHGFPFEGHCFGESYLFTDNMYAINAIALTTSEIFKVEKNIFLDLLVREPELLLKLNQYTADRMHFRYIMSSCLSISDPLIKLVKLLDQLKKYFGFKEKYSFLVPYTRKHLASLIGLRVETVIRTIKKWKRKNLSKWTAARFIIDTITPKERIICLLLIRRLVE
ncbi:Crp/Fnr family transcriptional regulator [Chryseobacterium sp. CT-SW4]|uniref:Crp/Fnr family transcriptional regulator n=1 Tax=Chryseobacterium sp. SW-1 TaxID=3157343 RepID=UPI003B0101CF